MHIAKTPVCLQFATKTSTAVEGEEEERKGLTHMKDTTRLALCDGVLQELSGEYLPIEAPRQSDNTV